MFAFVDEETFHGLKGEIKQKFNQLVNSIGSVRKVELTAIEALVPGGGGGGGTIFGNGPPVPGGSGKSLPGGKGWFQLY